jgi:membrane protease YdiL (CAAX protease family)
MNEKGYFTLKWILVTFALLFVSVWISFGLILAVRADTAYSMLLKMSAPLLISLVMFPILKNKIYLKLFLIGRVQGILTLLLYAIFVPLIYIGISRIEGGPYVIHLFAISIAEEFYCRGVLNQEFRKHYSPLASLWMVSLMFAFMFHMNEAFIQNLWQRLPMGLLLGYTFNQTNNLWIPILLHTIFNTAVIILYSGG